MVTSVPESTTNNPVTQASLNPYYAPVNHTHSTVSMTVTYADGATPQSETFTLFKQA